MMRAVLIGYGEIGKAVKKVFGDAHKIKVIANSESDLPDEKYYDVMLVAIPYSEKFLDDVKAYLRYFEVSSIIVFSTTQIGTCSQIGAIHSPVEGKHPDLAESIRKMPRWLGGRDQMAVDFMKQAGLQVKVVSKPEITEALKLTSTTLYGVNIEFARYREKIAKELEMDFNHFIEFDKDYNELYKSMGMPQFSRYLLTPPRGVIGGHCVVPNAKILKEKFPDEFLDKIINYV
jgi:hypothetical protein